jgi:hypothetical protein
VKPLVLYHFRLELLFVIELASVAPISIATRGGRMICLEFTGYKKSDVFLSSDGCMEHLERQRSALQDNKVSLIFSARSV